MQNQIQNYIRAGYSGLYLLSHEEARVEAVLRSVAASTGFKLHAWSITSGIVEIPTVDDSQPSTLNAQPLSGTEDPFDMLTAFAGLPEKSILLARDLHLSIDPGNPVFIRKLKEALAVGKATSRVLVVLACQLRLPPELEKEFTVVEFKLPDRRQLLAVLQGIAASAKITLNGNTDRLLDAAGGLTTIEAENAFSLSVIEARDILPAIVAREKAATLRKNGILEIIDTPLSLESIGGLELLKAWLGKRRAAFSPAARDYGLPTPKGFLMLGIPGCGKSLTAKATAAILGVPLLKLDAGKLFGSLVGESERNLRSAIQTAEAVAPAVLWIDEVDKAFDGVQSSGQTDGGTTARVFGHFLDWMQEKTSAVFVVATANDISRLPSALLRKGRFDELFFIDLPDRREREAIWRIQIARHRRDPEQFDLPALADLSANWTGSEIEACFVDALYAAFECGRDPDTLRIASAATNLVPLSRTMAGDLSALRDWAKNKARPASAPTPAANAVTRKLAGLAG